MKCMFSPVMTSTFAFILSILAILVIAVSAPGMAQAATVPAAAPASSGYSQPGNSIQQSSYYGLKVNPAANFGSLTDNGTAAYMGIGIAVPLGPLHIYSTTSTQPETIDLSGAGPLTAQWNNWGPGGASSGTGFLARFSRGTKASPADVQVGDRLGFNVFGGMAGGLFKHTAAIEAVVDTGTVSGTSLPTYMRFLTTPNGSTARVERMRIDSAGRVGINTTPDSGATLKAYSATGNAVHGNSNSTGTGVAGTSIDGMGLYGTSTSNTGVYASSSSGYGVYAISATGGKSAVYGQHQATGNFGTLGDNQTGVYGHSDDSYGVYGDSSGGDAIYGKNTYSGNYGYLGGWLSGVYGFSNDAADSGVYGDSSFSSTGVYGQNYTTGNVGKLGTPIYGVYGSSTIGYAGYFNGDVWITGDLHKGSGSFTIDHPLDPANKFLNHSFVESPDMMNVYNGNIMLDGNGMATVELPSYFQSLNRDFRYQLTPLGAPGPNLYIAQKVAGNQFKIAGGSPGSEVSWMVTGVRQDAFANAHPIVVEQEKPANEKGLYLHPVEWRQPIAKGISQAFNK